jgi:hypothetical protein
MTSVFSIHWLFRLLFKYFKLNYVSFNVLCITELSTSCRVATVYGSCPFVCMSGFGRRDPSHPEHDSNKKGACD